MTTIYNRVQNYFNISERRTRLVKLLFPEGLPTDTVALSFSANSIVADQAPTFGYNRIALGSGASADQRIKYSYRYRAPAAGTNENKVLIWVNGHETNKFDDAYPATVTNGGKITHAQRVQFDYLPTAPINAAWKLPLQNGIGIIEVSLLGEYLNSIRANYGHSTTDHDKIVSDLGAEAVGLFLYPIIVAVNTAVAAGKKVAIGGFSGGGWAALMAAAIDPRIRVSFTQSGWTGTLADGVVAPNAFSGDGEQTQSDVYTIANAHELALMGVDAGREAIHIWNTTQGTGQDAVLGITPTDLAGLQTGGLSVEALRYGGRLEFVGFDGLNDPVTNFGNNASATYTSIANSVASCLNAAGTASGADPGTFTYSGTGHHVLNQAIDLITKRIIQDL